MNNGSRDKRVEQRLRARMRSYHQIVRGHPGDGTGQELDRQAIFYNGAYFKGQKLHNKWRMFKESKHIEKLTQSISDPPTQAEVQAIQSKLNEVVEAISL